MAHITISGVTSEVEDLVNEFVAKLADAGHTAAASDQGAQAPAVDPFAGQDIDSIPAEVLQRMGISREELRRGRAMTPAVDVNAHHATATPPAPAPEPAAAAPEPPAG